MTRYAPFYPRAYKQLDNNELGTLANLVNRIDDNGCDDDNGAAGCDAADDPANFSKTSVSTPPKLQRGATFFGADEFAAPDVEYVPARDDQELLAIVTYFVNN